jgi:hypothetical protein
MAKPQEGVSYLRKGIAVAKKNKRQHALSELLGVYNGLQDELDD